MKKRTSRTEGLRGPKFASTPALPDAAAPSASDGPAPTEVLTKPPAVVGLGASAGGLDAFLRVLHRLPPDAGLAYVLVQHLSPEHESHLPELLGRAAAIPVVHAEDGMRVEADHAYVIPPNTTLTLTDGHLRLVARKRGRGPHLSVDAFLCSLARVHGSGAVGVILSGSGSDGARGVEAIKEAGGITMAQDSASARHPNMPEAAVATGSIDFILTPEEIAEQLGRLGRHLTQHGGNGATAEASSPRTTRRTYARFSRSFSDGPGLIFSTTGAAPCIAASSGACWLIARRVGVSTSPISGSTPRSSTASTMTS